MGEKYLFLLLESIIVVFYCMMFLSFFVEWRVEMEQLEDGKMSPGGNFDVKFEEYESCDHYRNQRE
jgi:hypothetical protein